MGLPKIWADIFRVVLNATHKKVPKVSTTVRLGAQCTYIGNWRARYRCFWFSRTPIFILTRVKMANGQRGRLLRWNKMALRKSVFCCTWLHRVCRWRPKSQLLHFANDDYEPAEAYTERRVSEDSRSFRDGGKERPIADWKLDSRDNEKPGAQWVFTISEFNMMITHFKMITTTSLA